MCVSAREPVRESSDAEYARLQDAVDMFEVHLIAAELLAKHQCPKPLAFFRKLCSAEGREDAILLIETVCRKAERAKPKFTDDKWESLIKDLLEMRAKAFPFLAEEIIYMRACQSLLATSNFILAQQLLTPIDGAGGSQQTRVQSQQSRSQSAGKNAVADAETGGQKRALISRENAEQLVIGATREFFNSAPSADHELFRLAKECATNILPPPRSPALESEASLIKGVEQLEALGLAVVPVQVSARALLSHSQDVFFLSPPS